MKYFSLNENFILSNNLYKKKRLNNSQSKIILEIAVKRMQQTVV